jgi:hypothetical protein
MSDPKEPEKPIVDPEPPPPPPDAKEPEEDDRATDPRAIPPAPPPRRRMSSGPDLTGVDPGIDCEILDCAAHAPRRASPPMGMQAVRGPVGGANVDWDTALIIGASESPPPPFPRTQYRSTPR